MGCPRSNLLPRHGAWLLRGASVRGSALPRCRVGSRWLSLRAGWRSPMCSCTSCRTGRAWSDVSARHGPRAERGGQPYDVAGRARAVLRVERALVVPRGGRIVKQTTRQRHFWLHIAASGLLIFIVAYLLNYREDETAGGLILFFVALLLHFVTPIAQLRRPRNLRPAGRWALVGARNGVDPGLLVELPESRSGACSPSSAGPWCW